jgi:hypothetical protein
MNMKTASKFGFGLSRYIAIIFDYRKSGRIKSFVVTIILPLVTMISCSTYESKELMQLPVQKDRRNLDSLQALSVYNVAKYFPNGSELAIALIRGDSDQFIGIR